MLADENIGVTDQNGNAVASADGVAASVTSRQTRALSIKIVVDDQ